MAHLLCRRGPLGQVLIERPHHGVRRLDRNFGRQLAQWRKAERRLELRIAAGQQMMHRGGQRVEIRARLDLAHVLFGRRVADRADLRAPSTGWQEARDSEIDQHRAAVLVDHDIAGLQIAVNYRRLLPVQKFEHVEHLARPSQHLVLGDFALGAQLVEHVLQIAARDKFHHQIMARVLGEVIDQRRDARMRQPREHVGLAGEVLDRFFLPDSVADDHFLDRDRPVRQARVVGQVHASHPADAEHFLDAIATVEKMSLGECVARIHGDCL